MAIYGSNHWDDFKTYLYQAGEMESKLGILVVEVGPVHSIEIDIEIHCSKSISILSYIPSQLP